VTTAEGHDQAVSASGFDHVSMGGLPARRATEVAGQAGSAETVFAGQFLAEGVRRGQPPHRPDRPRRGRDGSRAPLLDSLNGVLGLHDDPVAARQLLRQLIASMRAMGLTIVLSPSPGSARSCPARPCPGPRRQAQPVPR